MRLVAVLGFSTLSALSFSATFSVANLGDSGAGSLRQAILSANANPGADTIQIEVSGVIPITSGQLAVSEDLIINGPGADILALDAQARSRIFNVSAGRLQLTGMTLKNGKAAAIQFGGGIFVNGELALRRCALISNEVPLNVGFNADGGGVFVNSGKRMTADQCLFLNNKVGLGTGGGVRGASSSVLEFRNCTFSGNSATQGGALSCAGSAKLDFCTMADNHADNSGGGAWAAVFPYQVSNSIIAHNSAPSGPDWFGPAQSLGYNLVGTSANSSGWGLSDLLNADPMLGPLGDYGGETMLYSLLEGSPALDSANPASFLAMDQRDMARPQAAGPDRGAYEAEPFNEAPVANAGPDQSVECNGLLTEVHLDGSGSSDPDGDELHFEWSEAGVLLAEGSAPLVQLPKGEHFIELRVIDPSGASSTNEVMVRIADTTAPSLGGVSASPGSLWPPNHKMWAVQVSYSVSDACDAAPSVWLTAESSEADSGLSSEDVPFDIEILDGHRLKLRAERFGDGRIYTITVHARDHDGNESSAPVQVRVPKSMGR